MGLDVGRCGSSRAASVSGIVVEVMQTAREIDSRRLISAGVVLIGALLTWQAHAAQTARPPLRVERLLDRPIITPELHPSIGPNIQAIVQIKLEQHSDEIVERFRRTLIERPEVLACYTLTGEMDFLLHVIVRDIEALSDFTTRRLLRVAGVRDVKSSIVLETVKRSPVIPLEELAPE